MSLVSVVVPAFNAAATIERSLKSALDQSYANVEVIVVDDGSSDATADIVARMGADEPRLRLIRSENRGAAQARNTAIAASSGEYIAPLDADDLWHPDKIARQVAAAEAAPEAGFVYVFHHFIDGDDRIIGWPEAYVCRGRVFHRLYYRNFVGTGSAPLFRRRAIVGAGGYEAAGYSEDALLQLKVARGWPVECVPDRLVGYRVSASSLTRRSDAFVNWMGARDRMDGLWPDLPPFVRRWARAWRWLALAEQRGWEGRPGAAVAAMARAMWLDPDRTFRFLAFRSARAVTSRARRGEAGKGSWPFASPPPFSPVAHDPKEMRQTLNRFRRFEARRLETLRLLDEETPAIRSVLF